MFQNCYSLTSVPLFNTAGCNSANGMSGMFYNCTSLASVPLFNTAAVTNMSNMFYSCTSLTSVPLFNTAAVTDMSSMFYSCSSLTSVPLFAVKTSGTITLTDMFYKCYSLATGALSATRNTISYASCKLGKAALESIFDNLGIAATATITTTSNYGSVPVSKASSGTTAGSDAITMASTASLATGMEVTGTGVSDALACTIEPAADTITITGHGIPDGTPVSLATLVTSTGIAVNTIYYVRDSAANTLKLALAAGGAAIDITGSDGSGTLRRPMLITDVQADHVHVSSPCSASGTVTVVATALLRWKALLKAWTVVP